MGLRVGGQAGRRGVCGSVTMGATFGKGRSVASRSHAMAAKQVVPGLWEVPLGFVNAFLLDTGEGLALIDTGVAGSAGAIVEAIKGIGREPGEVRQVLVTHCHSD